MSNPFDQFSSDFRAAVPDAGPPSGQPAGAPQPVMNAPQQPPPPMGGGMYGQPPPQQQPPMGGGMYGQPPPPGQPSNAMVPSSQPSNPYGGLVGMGGAPPPAAPGGPPPLGGMYGQPPPPATAPGGPPPLGGMYGQPPPPQQQPPQQPPPSMSASMTGSFVGGAAPAAALSADPFGASYGAPPPAPQPAPAPAPQPAYNPDPFGAAPAPAQPAYNPDPFGAAPAPPAPAPAPGALVPSTAPPSDDPFGVFGSPAPVAAAAPVTPAAPAPAVTDDDPFGMGFSSAPAVADTTSVATPAPVAAAPTPTEIVSRSAPTPAAAAADTGAPRKSGDLPPGGEWYDARIFTPTLGVMFFKPQELTDSLFLQTEKSLVDALDERPVVAFIVEGSSARSAGVELGHVLLKVNGIDVKNPKDASRLIKEGPRPLPLLFYVPDTTVVVAEGEHMVKYDTRETGAPNSAKDWKPKYVVIGGIIAQPWVMNMYRSKSEYDIAVIETQARRPVSVKVKQFSLQGARIQNDWQGPQMVKYKNKLHPWKYIVILPVARNPIKISSPNLSQLKPVHEGIRRVLMAQQRGHGHQGRTAAPVRQGGDAYGQRGHSPPRGGGGYGADVSGGVGGPRRAQY